VVTLEERWHDTTRGFLMTGVVQTENSTQPVDIATMRQTIGRLLPPDVEPVGTSEVETLTSLLRGHMQLIIPEIEHAAGKPPKDDVPRYCALACIGEARAKLRAAPGHGPHRAVAYARRLARCLAALCDHYEALTGVEMCLACDQPIKNREDSVPYGHVSASGGAACAGRIHTRCAHTGRRR
jgi:hypothetical protein